MDEINVGDKVKIRDGSYALEIGSGFVGECDIGMNKNLFQVIKKFDYGPKWKSYREYCLHDIIIVEIATLRQFLHSSPFVYLLKYNKKIVKPLKELMLTLIDEGYEPDTDTGNFVPSSNFKMVFNKRMFSCCGKEVDYRWSWKESWLTTIKE